MMACMDVWVGGCECMCVCAYACMDVGVCVFAWDKNECIHNVMCGCVYGWWVPCNSYPTPNPTLTPNTTNGV